MKFFIVSQYTFNYINVYVYVQLSLDDSNLAMGIKNKFYFCVYLYGKKFNVVFVFYYSYYILLLESFIICCWVEFDT